MRLIFISIYHSRHRLLHILSLSLCLLLGFALFATMLVFGLMMAGIGLVAGGFILLGSVAWLAARRWLFGHTNMTMTQQARTHHKTDVLEGEFTVINQKHPHTH